MLLKTASGAYSKSKMENVLLEPISLEWMIQAHNLSKLIKPLFLKVLHKLFSYNTYKVKYVTLPNGTNFINKGEFKYYYDTLIKLIKQGPGIVQQQFCEPPCLALCPCLCL